MNVRVLLFDDAWPVRPEDTAATVADRMQLAHIRHLPVVDESERVIGLLTASLLEHVSDDALVNELLMSPPVGIEPEAHLFEAADRMLQQGLSALPVVSEDGFYLGLIRRADVFDQMTRLLALHKPGAILELEMEARDYTVGQLVYVIEQNDAKILSLASDISEQIGGMARITLKLNTADASRIRHVLEHHGYRVTRSFSEDVSQEDIQRRIDAFMRYLEV